MSQPIKVVVVFVVMVLVVVLVIVVDVVVVVVFAFVLVHIVVVDPRKQPLKFGQNCISNSINDVEFPEVVGCGGGWVVV